MKMRQRIVHDAPDRVRRPLVRSRALIAVVAAVVAGTGCSRTEQPTPVGQMPAPAAMPAPNPPPAASIDHTQTVSRPVAAAATAPAAEPLDRPIDVTGLGKMFESTDAATRQK